MKLPLFIGSLIALVVALNTWAEYRGHLRESRTTAVQRLNQVADEMAQSYQRTLTALGGQLSATAANPSLAAYLGAPAAGGRAHEPAMDALRVVSGAPQTISVELWDSAGRTLLATGRSAQFRNAKLDTTLMARARASAGPVVGRLRAAGDSEAYAIVEAVRAGHAVRGYVVHWRSITTARADQKDASMLIGTGGRIFAGNAHDSVWTDLSKRANPPPVDVSHATGVLEYQRRAGRMLAVVRPVPDTPWDVVIEFPTDSVGAPARAMIRAMLWIDALVLLVGLAGAWLLSRRLTSRLAHLTTAAESLGAEGVAPTPRDAAAGDEITRLGIAFDAMAHRVVDALTAREASEEQYRGLFESVPLPLYVADLDTRRFRAVNAALVESYGYSREELAQLTINNIRPADDLARLAQELQDLGERPSHRGQWQHVRKDGSVIDVEVVAHRCLFEGRPAVLCLANDVTARNRAALALQRSEERYRALIRESPYGIALSTPDGELLEVNPALVAMLGYDEPGQLLGTSVRNLYVDPAAREAIADELRRTGHSRQDALQWRRRDRRTLTARFSARLVPASRDAEAYVEAIIEDVTERLRLEEQFQQAQRMEAVGRLAGGIAHDFNNLLTVIMTTTELLLDAGTTTGSEHSELQDVYRSAQRGAELTRQLLAFSRRQVLTMQPLSVGALVADLKSLITRLIGEDVHLRVARAPDTDIVRADPTQLEQVLLNLAVNARDAMPNGGHLTIETGPVEIGPGTDDRPEPMTGGAYVRIVVSDTGEGMTDEVREHAFEPFFTTKDREKGTGLGLATVYGIVKQLGGYVWVNSELGKGTAFRIYLPRVADVPGEPVREASRRDAGAGAGTETVLIAEDEEAIRALLVRVLKSRGYQVLAEPSGEEALRRAAEFRDHIDLLVTDVVMTGMSGPQLAGRLAEIHPETTPLFLSGYTDEAVLKFGVAAGTVAFLQKPFTHNAFLAKVREVLDGVKR